MAKSIRSKRGRKLRAFKRIRYGEKELARLKNMLAKAVEEEKNKIVSENNTQTEANNAETQADAQIDQESNIKPSKYPCWLSQFKIKKLAKQERKQKRKEIKRLKKEKLKLKKGKKKKKSV